MHGRYEQRPESAALIAARQLAEEARHRRVGRDLRRRRQPARVTSAAAPGGRAPTLPGAP
ncbi:hypothetical protein [Blastococcus sp. SYSU DS1024]